MQKTGARKIFGTDGVRGRANHYPMTVETAMALGRAAGKLLRRHDDKHRVVVGKDTRLSCYMFENALISGLCSMGIDTLMVGPFPTPGIAFITRAYRADAGIIISASHNPYHDNGIKFFSAEGYKFPDSWEHEMEALMEADDYSDCLPHDHNVGKNKRIDDADGRYIEFVKATFPRCHSLKGMKIALDCANGAGYKVAPLVFRELDATVFVTGNKPNGLNINEGCGALHPQKVQQAVLENGADVGIALDGDADRLIMIDEKGNILDGDTILAICACDMKVRGGLRNNRVVATVMSNYGFFKAMKAKNIDVITSPVGDRYVIQEMIKNDVNLGGEQSGHLIFHDHNTTGDGLVSALQVLRIMTETGTKLSDLAAVFERCPQANVNVPVSQKPPIESLESLEKAVSDARGALGDDGRVLVRYSGTEPICRVMVEGPDVPQVDAIAGSIARVIEDEIGVK